MSIRELTDAECERVAFGFLRIIEDPDDLRAFHRHQVEQSRLSTVINRAMVKQPEPLLCEGATSDCPDSTEYELPLVNPVFSGGTNDNDLLIYRDGEKIDLNPDLGNKTAEDYTPIDKDGYILSSVETRRAFESLAIAIYKRLGDQFGDVQIWVSGGDRYVDEKDGKIYSSSFVEKVPVGNSVEDTRHLTGKAVDFVIRKREVDVDDNGKEVVNDNGEKEYVFKDYSSKEMDQIRQHVLEAYQAQMGDNGFNFFKDYYGNDDNKHFHVDLDLRENEE